MKTVVAMLILGVLVWAAPVLAADAPVVASSGWSSAVIISFFLGLGGLVTVTGGVLVKVIVALRETRVALSEIKTAASDLDKKVDGVKADVAQVHEATNGLSHRLAEASSVAGFGRGQEKERVDERLRTAQAAAGIAGTAPAVVAPPAAPPAAPPDASADILARIEAMLREPRT